MSPAIFELLTSHNDDEAVINTFGDARGAARPEVFIPVLITGGDGAPPPPTLVTEVGASVRITSGARLGEIGRIVDVTATPHTMESGALAWGAEVELGASRLFVPWENLELIG
jgi:hypothetical protein